MARTLKHVKFINLQNVVKKFETRRGVQVNIFTRSHIEVKNENFQIYSWKIMAKNKLSNPKYRHFVIFKPFIKLAVLNGRKHSLTYYFHVVWVASFYFICIKAQFRCFLFRSHQRSLKVLRGHQEVKRVFPSYFHVVSRVAIAFI